MLPDRVSNPGPLTYESGALEPSMFEPVKFYCICSHSEADNNPSYSRINTVSYMLVQLLKGTNMTGKQVVLRKQFSPICLKWLLTLEKQFICRWEINNKESQTRSLKFSVD